MFTSTTPLLLNFRNGTIFRSTPTVDLLRSYALFTAFSFNPLITHSFRIHQRFPGLFRFLARPAFSHFCAGASEAALGPRRTQLRSQGVGSILDYAAESSEDVDKNVFILERAISAVSGSDDRVAMKLTALAPVEVLQRFSAECSLKDESFPEYMHDSILRIQTILTHAYNKQVHVYIDAEWLAIQPAIEAITLHFMKKYNKDRVTISTTYQCYLKRTLSVVQRDVQLAKLHGFKIGAKVVRGAYLSTERDRAKRLGVEDPVCEDYIATSVNYHAVLDLLNKEQVVDHILVASHNPDSVNYTLAEGTPSSKINYAQLLGMADNITFTLGAAKKPVFKYMPYGPMEEVIPYLLRRAMENSALMGSVHVKNEKAMVKAELCRRLFRRVL